MPERRPAAPPQVLLERCTGCGACVAACGPDAITLVLMESGAKKAHVDPVACHLHGDCLAACPHEALFAWKWQQPATR